MSLSVFSTVSWHYRPGRNRYAEAIAGDVYMHSFRRRHVRVIAAVCGLAALVVLGVSSAVVGTPNFPPRIVPLSGSMTLGGTSTVTTALPSPEIASASPAVKAPHK
jgi:hypothetical protein